MLHGWIATLEGGHIVCPGDWIITGVKGEMYPCKPDIFEATYEEGGNIVLDCGHPTQASELDEHGELECVWCSELDTMQIDSAHNAYQTVKNDVAAARADERVKARNEALTECANDDAAYAASCSDDMMADAWRSSAHRHLIKLMLSEAPPVEPSEGKS